MWVFAVLGEEAVGATQSVRGHAVHILTHEGDFVFLVIRFGAHGLHIQTLQETIPCVAYQQTYHGPLVHVVLATRGEAFSDDGVIAHLGPLG